MQPQDHKQKVGIVTDSSVCLARSLVQEYDIHIIPFQLLWDGEVYLDGEDMTRPEFFQRLSQDGDPPTTAQPLPESFAEMYEKVAQEAESILSLHIPESLSTTIQVARLMAREASVPVHVMSTGTAGPGLGLVALAAARAAKAGASLRQISAVAKACSQRVGLYIVMETLKYLNRGGRIGQAAALVGTRLSIQPVLQLKEGRIHVTAVVRNRERAKERMLDEMERRVGSCAISTVIFHAIALDEAQELAQQIRQRFQCIESWTMEFTPVVGVHTGPGSLGVAFCLQDA